jgi:sporadic carbohydrate cluster 2OG-Fe(II) oxygenase
MINNLASRKNKNFFLKNGYLKFKLKKKNYLYCKKIIENKIWKITKKKFRIEKIHEYINFEQVNYLRLKIYEHINKNKQFHKSLILSSENHIDSFVGSELVVSNYNLSIQMPKDQSSILGMHTDFFSGESVFQINLWFPFSNIKKTASMFILNPKDSLLALKKIKYDKNFLIKDIFSKYKNKIKWINFKEGEAMMFSPNCLHGNVNNLEKNTRWSINVRFKNLYSPYFKEKENDKKIGVYYKLFTPKLITEFNAKYNFYEISKK